MKTESLARPGKKQRPHAGQFLQGIAALEFFRLLTISPFIVAGRIDERSIELLELVVNRLIPVGGKMPALVHAMLPE